MLESESPRGNRQEPPEQALTAKSQSIDITAGPGRRAMRQTGSVQTSTAVDDIEPSQPGHEELAPHSHDEDRPESAMCSHTGSAHRALAETSVQDSDASVIAETSSAHAGAISVTTVMCDKSDGQIIVSAATREAEFGTQTNSRTEAQTKPGVARVSDLTAQVDGKVSEANAESRAGGISVGAVDEGQHRDPAPGLAVEHSTLDDALDMLEDIHIEVGAADLHLALAIKAKISDTTHLACAGIASADAQKNASPPADIGDDKIVTSDDILSMSPRVYIQAESPRSEASEEGTKNAQYLPTYRLPITTGSGHGRASWVGRLGGAQTHQHSLTHS